MFTNPLILRISDSFLSFVWFPRSSGGGWPQPVSVSWDTKQKKSRSILLRFQEPFRPLPLPSQEYGPNEKGTENLPTPYPCNNVINWVCMYELSSEFAWTLTPCFCLRTPQGGGGSKSLRGVILRPRPQLFAYNVKIFKILGNAKSPSEVPVMRFLCPNHSRETSQKYTFLSFCITKNPLRGACNAVFSACMICVFTWKTGIFPSWGPWIGVYLREQSLL